MTPGDVVRWGPELLLALAAAAGAAGVARASRGPTGVVVACSLALLACDAALGAAEYAAAGSPNAFTAPHATLTAAFRTAGFAAVLAGQVAVLTTREGSRRVLALASAGLGALVAALAVPLPPVLVLAHAAAALSGRAPGRPGAAAAAAALLAVIVSQLVLPPLSSTNWGDVRLLSLHLGLAAWALALPWAFRRAVRPVRA